MQLLMYLLDTRASYLTYLLIFMSQKGSIEALNFLILHVPHRLHHNFELSHNHKK